MKAGPAICWVAIKPMLIGPTLLPLPHAKMPWRSSVRPELWKLTVTKPTRVVCPVTTSVPLLERTPPGGPLSPSNVKFVWISNVPAL
jgi:hypothetical protein